MNINELLISEFDLEMAKTRTMLERVPFDEPGWKPSEKSMTIARLASHLSELPEWLTHVIHLDSLKIDKSYKGYIASSCKDLLHHFDTKVAEARAALAHTTEQQFDRPWSLSYDGSVIFSKPKRDVIRETVFNHAIHHRGQLSVYLRLKGVAVPGMYGASADETQ